MTPSPEARPDLEAAREKARRICEALHPMQDSEEKLRVRIAELILEHEAEREALQRERDRGHKNVEALSRALMFDCARCKKNVHWKDGTRCAECKAMYCSAPCIAEHFASSGDDFKLGGERARRHMDTVKSWMEAVEKAERERDTALADLAAAREDERKASNRDVEEALDQRDEARRDLAALRRRVGEAERQDSNHLAWMRERMLMSPHAQTAWRVLNPLFDELDHARAAAGELRGMLREACEALAENVRFETGSPLAALWDKWHEASKEK